MNEKNSIPMFKELHGQQLSAISFVQDYLQLWFDGPCINVTNPLTVSAADKTVTSWKSGFRDLLCSQIAKIVAAVEHCPASDLTIHFADGSFISISLRPEDYTSPEAFYAHGFSNDQWICA